MAEIIITYKTYTTTYLRLTEEEFYTFKKIKEISPQFEILRIKNKKDFRHALFNEFKYSIGSLLFLGFLIGFFDYSHYLIILFIPLILWLVLGGTISIMNFIEDFNSSKKYCDVLHEKFINFENYQQYLYFHKFQSSKL